MRILFIGLGSIGSRHIKNLSAVLAERGIDFEIDALRSGERPLREGVAELLNASYPNFESLPHDYDVAFVTNPTSMHEETVKKAAAVARDLFIEKPVFSETDVDVDALGLKADSVYYVACPLRHKAVLQRLKEACVEQGKPPVAARAICSSYLPEWRKGTDYRTCYSAHRDQGGGVVLDLIHEWDYLSHLLGLPERVQCMAGQRSALEIDSDDVAVYIADFGRTLLSLHLDYVGRVSERVCTLFFDDETVEADILANTLTFKKAGRTETFPANDFYVTEMNYFIDCVLSRRTDNMNTVPHALAVLKAATQQ